VICDAFSWWRNRYKATIKRNGGNETICRPSWWLPRFGPGLVTFARDFDLNSAVTPIANSKIQMRCDGVRTAAARRMRREFMLPQKQIANCT
jgi:hypothetical protein